MPLTPTQELDLVSTREAARRLNVSVGRIRKLIQEDRIKAQRFGTRDWLIPVAELRKFKRRPSGAPGHISRKRAKTKPKAEKPAAARAA